MTVLWVMLTIMTSAAAVIVAIPFLRRMDKRRDELREIEIYRDQSREVEKNVAAGLIDPTEAEAAALEIKRRLLAANHTGETGTGALTPVQRRYAVIAITGFVVVGSTILYTVTGSPELASGDAVRGMMATGGDGALPPRHPPVQGQMQAQTAPQIITARAETQQQGEQGGAPDDNLGSVDDMIERVQRRVEKNPADVDGWRMLGWSYLRTDRPQQAVDAYSKAVALKADDAELQSAYADALIKASGTITDAAKGLVDKALQLNPNDPQARYIKGMIQVEAGDRQGAIETWVALLNDIDQSAETAADLRGRLTNLAKEAGVDITARLPQLNAETPPTDGHGGLAPLKPLVQGQAQQQEKGPTAADVSAAEAMTPEQRQALIHGMVDQLAERLEKSPRDADGWIRLIRSRRTLGEMEAAKTALEKSLAAFTDAPQEQERIRTVARELGMTQ